VVSSPPAPKETGTMGREIKSRQGIDKVAFYIKKLVLFVCTYEVVRMTIALGLNM
jgi:hypothetical protein